MSDNRLEALLRTALREGVLSPDELPAFAEALREQARLILEARVRPLEERARALEREVAWRSENQKALQKEVAWRAETQQALERQIAGREREIASRAEAQQALEKEIVWRAETQQALEKEIAWRTETQQGLEQEVAWRRSQLEAQILRFAHHRTTLTEIIEILVAASDLPWRRRSAREVRAAVCERLAALEASLAKEGTA